MRQHATIGNHRQQEIGQGLGGKLPPADIQPAGSNIDLCKGEFGDAVGLQRVAGDGGQAKIKRIALENTAKGPGNDGPNTKMLQRLGRLLA